MRYTGRKGWQASYRDTWNLDITLSPIILTALKKFKEVMDDTQKNSFFGVPVALCENPDRCIDEDWEKWCEIIDKMIYSFDEGNIPNRKDYDFDLVEGEHHGEEHGEGEFIRFHMEPTNEKEWDRYMEDTELHAKALQEGRELFGKYFGNLWW